MSRVLEEGSEGGGAQPLATPAVSLCILIHEQAGRQAGQAGAQTRKMCKLMRAKDENVSEAVGGRGGGHVGAL